jgi:serine/threonine protein kinase
MVSDLTNRINPQFPLPLEIDTEDDQEDITPLRNLMKRQDTPAKDQSSGAKSASKLGKISSNDFVEICADNVIENPWDSPKARCGEPWYVVFGTLKSTGEHIVLKKLRQMWDPFEYLYDELRHVVLANKVSNRVIPFLGCYPSTERNVQFVLVFPRYLPLDSYRISELSLATVEKILLQLSEGLWQIHQIGLVHLDISTNNVVLHPTSNDAFIIDFGHSDIITVNF